MEMSELRKKLQEALPEDAMIDEEILEQVAGGLPVGMDHEELMSRLSALGIIRGRLMDAKPGEGGGGLPKPKLH